MQAEAIIVISGPYGAALGPVARDVLGDVLWAIMIAWGAGALGVGVALAALLESAAVARRMHRPSDI